jgi:hypothetical protein
MDVQISFDIGSGVSDYDVDTARTYDGMGAQTPGVPPAEHGASLEDSLAFWGPHQHSYMDSLSYGVRTPGASPSGSQTPSMAESATNDSMMTASSLFDDAPAGPEDKPQNTARKFLWDLFDVQSHNARQSNPRYTTNPNVRPNGAPISPRAALMSLTPRFFAHDRIRIVDDVNDSEALYATLVNHKVVSTRGSVYQTLRAPDLMLIFKQFKLNVLQLKKIEWTLQLLHEFSEFRIRRQFEAVHTDTPLMEIKWVGIPDEEHHGGILNKLRTLNPLRTPAPDKIQKYQRYWAAEKAWADAQMQPGDLMRARQISTENLQRRKVKDAKMKADFQAGYYLGGNGSSESSLQTPQRR